MSDTEKLLSELRDLVVRAHELDALAALKAEFQKLTASEVAPVGDTEPDAEWHGMIGQSPVILSLRDTLTKFAAAPSPVLIRGESGTGKDLVARILHQLSPRAKKSMVAENCAAIPETLLESTLFGHVRGAFTGAVKNHDGHFVAADGGTLFLDEIGDMPLAMQAKLLRALQEGEVRPVGGERVRKVDVRVVAATNRDLEQLVKDGTFREDLFYRLNVLQVTLPPLRDRGNDVVLLAKKLLFASAEKTGRELHLGPSAEAAMSAYAWPGNIRQLQNELQRVAALADGPEVTADDLSPDVAAAAAG